MAKAKVEEFDKEYKEIMDTIKIKLKFNEQKK
jgi:hypothetical protein